MTMPFFAISHVVESKQQAEPLISTKNQSSWVHFPADLQYQAWFPWTQPLEILIKTRALGKVLLCRICISTHSQRAAVLLFSGEPQRCGNFSFSILTCGVTSLQHDPCVMGTFGLLALCLALWHDIIVVSASDTVTFRFVHCLLTHWLFPIVEMSSGSQVRPQNPASTLSLEDYKL